jgi:hypothetical protein
MASWLEKHNEAVQATSRVPPFRHWVRGVVVEALGRGEVILQEVFDISAGPQAKAKYYSGMYSILPSFMTFLSSSGVTYRKKFPISVFPPVIFPPCSNKKSVEVFLWEPRILRLG